MTSKAFNNGFAHKLSKGWSKPMYLNSHYKGVSYTDIQTDIIFHNLVLKYYDKTGYGFFSGNIDINGTPAQMKVKLYFAGTKILVQETESMLHNGYFEFTNIADNEIYDMYAISPNGQYETKVKENITCLKYYKREITFSIIGVSKAPPINTRPIRFTMNARNTINKPRYVISNAPDWLSYDENTGLCMGNPKSYIKSIVLNFTVYDGDKSYEFIRTINFNDTRFVVEYSRNTANGLNDINATATIEYSPVSKKYENFPKGLQSLNLGDDYIHYKMNDETFKDISTGSYTLEITCKVNQLTANGVIFSSDATYGKNRFCVGYNNSTLYFNINGELSLTKCSFTQANIIENEWFVITIVKNKSTYYGFFNGVLLHQWSNSSATFMTNNLYVGNNKFDTTASSNITIRKVRFIKNISEFDDTYKTEYSFVNEKIAFPKVVFTYIHGDIKPDNYVNPVINVPSKCFINNGAYYANAYNSSTMTEANSPYIKLPNYNEVVDLGTSNWTIYTDIMITKDALSYSSNSDVYLISNESQASLFGVWLSGGIYSEILKPHFSVGGSTYSSGFDNKVANKIYYLKRHFLKIVRKKTYLYFFVDGKLVNKVSISATKTYKMLGSGNNILVGMNRGWSSYGYQYTACSTLGVILRKNIADIEEYDITDDTVVKYNTMKFSYSANTIDSYFDDKLTINGTINNTNRYIRDLSKQNFIIDDVYNLQSIFTIRLTGITVSTDIRQDLLTLYNPTTNEHFSLYCDIIGFALDANSSLIVTTQNNNTPFAENATFDIIISCTGKTLYIYLNGDLYFSLDTTVTECIFTKCIIGSDKTGALKSTSSSSVALFQHTNNVFFFEPLKPLLGNEYQNSVDFKYLVQNVAYNNVAFANLYTGVKSSKQTYSHRITEIDATNIKPFGDWTFECNFTLTSTYDSDTQFIYTCLGGSNSSYSHFSIRIVNYKIIVIYGGQVDRTNPNGTLTTYTTTEEYKSGANVHIAIVRTGLYVKIFIDGVMVQNKKVENFTPWFLYDSRKKPPDIFYNNSTAYLRGTIKYLRILNGISLYEDSFDVTPLKSSLPSEDLNTFPTTTSLPLRYKESFKE